MSDGGSVLRVRMDEDKTQVFFCSCVTSMVPVAVFLRIQCFDDDHLLVNVFLVNVGSVGTANEFPEVGLYSE